MSIRTIEETLSFYGQKVNPADFADVATSADIALLVHTSVSRVKDVKGIDLGIVASIVVGAIATAKTSYKPSHESGATFLTYVSRPIYWALQKGFKSREVFKEAPLDVPKDERDSASMVRLDHRSDQERFDLHDVVEGKNTSASTILEARELLWEVTDPIQVTLGILRVIPFSLALWQRAIDIFEGYFGLNGRFKQTLAEAARKWRIDGERPHQIIREVWNKLEVARAPIVNTFNLENALKRVSDLEEIIGEPVIISPLLPTEIERKEILDHFVQAKAKRKQECLASHYEFSLDDTIEPTLISNQRNGLQLLICRAFGVTPEDLQKLGRSTLRVSRVRNVASFLLREDLGVDFETIGHLIGRSKFIARHGHRYIGSQIKSGNSTVIRVIGVIRRQFIAKKLQ